MEYSRRKMPWPNALLLVVAILTANSATAAEVIGRAIYVTGEIKAFNKGESRLLARGSLIREGDALISGKTGRTQVRMSDGALIALRPNSMFRFDSYSYNKNKASESNSIFSLIRGGFRTITGLIGRNNKKNYQVNTLVATIGIRGTHYGLTLCQKGDCGAGYEGDIEDGLYGSVIEGKIAAKNETGLFTFSNDEYFHVSAVNSQPRGLLKPPGVIFDQGALGKLKKLLGDKRELAAMLNKRKLQQSASVQAQIERGQEYVRGRVEAANFESANDTGSNAFVIPSKQGSALAFSYFEISGTAINPVTDNLRDDGTVANSFAISGNAAQKGVFVPVAATKLTPAIPRVRNLSIYNAEPVDVGSVVIGDTGIGWGRWSGQYATLVNGSPVAHKGDLHYVTTSNVTTATELMALSALNASALYSTKNGTRATDLQGNIAADVADINMGVSFQGGTINSYNVATTVAGKDYQAELGTSKTIGLAITGGLTLSGATNGPCSNCVGAASIDFVGSQAQGAFTTYTIGDSSASNAVNGAAVMTRGDLF